MAAENNGERITAGEAEELLGVSNRTLASLIRRGVLKTQKDPVDRRVKLLKKSDVEQLKASSVRGRQAKKGGR